MLDERRQRHRTLWALGLIGLIVLVALVGTFTCLWFFTHTLRSDGVLFRTSASPSGEWVHRTYYDGYGPLAVSGTYRVEVSPASEPEASRIVYEGYRRVQTTWLDGPTLVVGGERLDVRYDSSDISDEPLEVLRNESLKVLFVVLPPAMVAAYGGFLLWRARRSGVKDSRTPSYARSSD